ncbi:hypothetical protein BDV96DRAFT_641562 [Lophiotrema nucula]|uniref:Uncharacterized protein n=1 Tax=Lophiotrema nucula TaxID=690887 RepID=A0A6A5ZPZ6_9PLEO|nr:hypothetical protein BDV96DRAFT_641562 [Lophiotrema nucula]
MSSALRPVAFSEDERHTREDEIADDYQAYLPALSSNTSNSLNDGIKHMSLGGDSRLATEPSTLRHQEDVADRNIAKWSRDGQTLRNSSLDTGDQAASRNSLGKSSLESHDPSSRTRRDSIPEHQVHTHYWNKQDQGAKVARDEVSLNKRRDRVSISSVPDESGPSRAQRKSAPLRHTPHIPDGDHSNLRTAFSDGTNDSQSLPYRQKRDPRGPSLEGVVNLQDSVDVDKTTRVAPAVTHEVVRPHEHEIIEEKIYREIHNHDVYHYILPVREVEVLPARHFVSTPDGNGLMEVPDTKFPGWAERNPAWAPSTIEELHEPEISHMPAKLTEPKIIDDKKYMTPEGYERRETTWLHPATLEDLSDYNGAVLPIHFVQDQPVDDVPDHEDILSAIPSNLVPPRKASLHNTNGRTSGAKSHDSVAY